MDSLISAENDILIKETFQSFDHDLDGRITKDQLGPALKELGIITTDEEISDFEHLANNSTHRGFVSYKEFYEFVKDKMPEDKDGAAGLVEAFKVYNRSGNGLVTAKEILHVLTSLGHELTEEEAREVVAEFDQGSNGGLNYEEFVQLSKS